MTTAEFFDYLSTRESSRNLAQDLLGIWVGVPPGRVEPLRVPTRRGR